MSQIQIFKHDTCPFSQKVMNYIDENNIDVEYKDIITHPENKDELIDLGGKKQVPFLYDADTDTRLYESDDIIQYLKEHSDS